VTEPDPRADRDRTLSRVRVTTAVVGVGAVAVTGALAGWLGQPGQVYGGAPATSTDPGTSAGSGTPSSDPSDGLSTPTEAPTAGGSGSSADQPPVVSGGS
jgi:hypothetical protein